ncbi:MAG: hypothetical protein R3C68_17255 [Myxococcota bacterium]
MKSRGGNVWLLRLLVLGALWGLGACDCTGEEVTAVPKPREKNQDALSLAEPDKEGARTRSTYEQAYEQAREEITLDTLAQHLATIERDVHRELEKLP